MAGGEGTRLRPVSENVPKPMVPMFDRPLLGHLFALLRENGVTDACLTLRYLPQTIREYIDGADFGVNLQSRAEKSALGTAGGVKNCADFIGDDDFLVISGDCVCDFDLLPLFEFHRKSGAEATIALHSHPEPLEYGLVLTDRAGRIEKFIEKPAWEGVVTDSANTGIYVLSPKLLGEIPDGVPFDFGKDLFPALLRAGRRLYGYAPEGYWCDVGNSEAYRKCCIDALAGRVSLDLRAPKIAEGVRSFAELPRNVTVTPPVYVGENAAIEGGAELGPYAAVGAGSVVRAGARVHHSVLHGASIGEDSEVSGAVVCRGASVGRGVKVCEGAVVGAGVVVGDGCVVSPGAKIWPEKRIPGGANVRGSVTHGMEKVGVEFASRGVIVGEVGSHITHEMCLRLGMAAGEYGRAGVGWCGGEAGRVLADVFAAGVNAAGGDAVCFDGGLLSCASFAAMSFALPLTVFVKQLGDRAEITFLGVGGVAISHDAERKLLARARDSAAVPARRTGKITRAGGMMDAYIAWASRQASGFRQGAARLAVPGGGAANRALRGALRLHGVSERESARGAAVFDVAGDGTSLTAADEDGRALDAERMLLIAALTELEDGVKTLAVPYDAPLALDTLAEAYGGTVLRTERDGEQAERVCARCVILRDGVVAALKICKKMDDTGETLAEMAGRVPRFGTFIREIPVKHSRGAVMRALASSGEAAAELDAGLRLDTGRGVVRIAPSRENPSLKIRGESRSTEAAAELAADFGRRVERIDAAIVENEET
jgi:mannose-1-phosphate guanylyltransferase/phosphomannomutase